MWEVEVRESAEAWRRSLVAVLAIGGLYLTGTLFPPGRRMCPETVRRNRFCIGEGR
jgi:hypothetical protein